MYHVNTPTPNQCLTIVSYSELPECPIQVEVTYNPSIFFSEILISSTKDQAGTGEGYFLFGGFLNKCRMKTFNMYAERKIKFLTHQMSVSFNFTDNGKVITSEVYELCICVRKYEPAETLENCKKNVNIGSIQRARVQHFSFGSCTGEHHLHFSNCSHKFNSKA